MNSTFIFLLNNHLHPVDGAIRPGLTVSAELLKPLVLLVNRPKQVK